jgi:hypothetical protein
MWRPRFASSLRAISSYCQTCTVLCDSTRKTLKIVTDSDSFDLPQEAFKPIREEIMLRIRHATRGS